MKGVAHTCAIRNERQRLCCRILSFALLVMATDFWKVRRAAKNRDCSAFSWKVQGASALLLLMAKLLQLGGNDSRSSCNWLWQPEPGSGCKPLKPQSGSKMSPHLGTDGLVCTRYSCSKCLHTSLSCCTCYTLPCSAAPPPSQVFILDFLDPAHIFTYIYILLLPCSIAPILF